MNRYGEKEHWGNVPILCQITLQNVPYMDLIQLGYRLKLHVLTKLRKPCKRVRNN